MTSFKYLYFTTFITDICVSTLFIYTLQGNSPYAPTSVGTNSEKNNIGQYHYGSAGNRISNGLSGGQQQTIHMGLINKPVLIQQGTTNTEELLYDPSNRRYLRVHADKHKTLYLSNMDYRIDGDKVTSSISIQAKNYSPDIQVDIDSSMNKEYTYFLKDHLGSPVSTTDDGGNKRSTINIRFDPWGRRSEATGIAQNLSDAKTIEKNRGYTGHETIASMNYTHMNGRIHDFEIGLFAGPDKFINGRSIANLNRYALGNNSNPNVLDWSGWMPLSSAERLAAEQAAARGIRRHSERQASFNRHIEQHKTRLHEVMPQNHRNPDEFVGNHPRDLREALFNRDLQEAIAASREGPGDTYDLGDLSRALEASEVTHKLETALGNIDAQLTGFNQRRNKLPELLEELENTRNQSASRISELSRAGIRNWHQDSRIQSLATRIDDLEGETSIIFQEIDSPQMSNLEAIRDNVAQSLAEVQGDPIYRNMSAARKTIENLQGYFGADFFQPDAL